VTRPAGDGPSQGRREFWRGAARDGPGGNQGSCQVRHQRVSQRKLDEILPAMPGTDSTLVTLEHASDDELHATGHQHLSLRQAALEDEASLDRPA
jgi:hypothetical protein